MTRPYTIDEITVAQLLKGHPKAEEIVDALFKSNKKTEGGEEFQDGSEDSIGKEGHAPSGRPGTIKHEGGNAVPGPNNPGVAAKNASEGEADLQKSGVERGTLTDNEPNKFKEGMEEDDTIPEGDEGEKAEPAQVGKSFDEATLSHLMKTLGPERFEEIFKAIVNPKTGKTGYLSGENPKTEGGVAGGPSSEQKKQAGEEKEMLRQRGLSALQAGLSKKSEDEEAELQKSEDGEEEMEKGGKHPQKVERAEWAKDREEEEREHAEKSFDLDYSEDILKAMGLEKGAPVTSKKVSGGTASQVHYGTKPETRWTHPKGGEEKRYRHNIKEGTVTVRSRKKGEKEFKEKEVGVGEEKKLKEASTSSPDLHKALDEILTKRG